MMSSISSILRTKWIVKCHSLCDGIMSNVLLRQSHRTFIHSDEDGRQLLPTEREREFILHRRSIRRWHSLRQTGHVMEADGCDDAVSSCAWLLSFYFVLTSFHCYRWSRIIHPNPLHETVKFHHFADDFMATFTCLLCAPCSIVSTQTCVFLASTAITRNFINVWWTR